MGYFKPSLFNFNFITSINTNFKFFSGDQSTLKYLFDTVLLDYSFNTLYLIFLTSFASLVFGIFPAWIISNYDFFGRKFFDIALYLL